MRNVSGNPNVPARSVLRCVAIVSLLALVAGCGKDPEGTGTNNGTTGTTNNSNNGTSDPDRTYEEVPEEPLALGGTACVLDMDCPEGRYCFQGACSWECDADDQCGAGEVCSDRGRCLDASTARIGTADGFVTARGALTEEDVDGESDAVVPGVQPGVTIVEMPRREHYIEPGQTKLKISFGTDVDVPGGAIVHRIERSLGEHDTRVTRVPGTRDFEVEIDTGFADPNAENPQVITADVITSVGVIRVEMIPKLSFSGLYAGNVLLDGFGANGLPLEFDIVTDPADARLEDANRAWLVLPVRNDSLFSPRVAAPMEIDAYESRELTYDPFVMRWVAVFRSEFELDQGTVLSGATTTPVLRTMRFELESAGDYVIGSMSDRWRGFYDSRTASGVSSIAAVSFEGDFEAQRVSPTEVPPGETDPLVEVTPVLQPLPPLDACAGVDVAALFTASYTDGPTTYDCSFATDLATFEAGTETEQSNCAIAVGESLSGGSDSTINQIFSWVDEDPTNDPPGTFSDWLADCASGDPGTPCEIREEVACARQLSSVAYAGQTSELPSTPVLFETFQALSRELYVGRQLAAFFTDAETRKAWLESGNVPDIAGLRGVVEGSLDTWSESVLSVHMAVLGGHLDASGLAVLGRAPANGASADGRKRLLTDVTQSWRAAADSLTLGTSRWNQVYQGDAERADRAEDVASRAFDLYLMSGMLSNLNRDAGIGFLNASLSAGFGNLLQELGELSQPFNKVAMLRDGEVVVSESLDPTSGNAEVLARLEDDATRAVDDADARVVGILSEIRGQALSAASLTTFLNTNIASTQAELVDLCGLPTGCTVEDVGTVGCEVRTGPGECGFIVDNGDILFPEFSSANVSQAGADLGAIIAASGQVGIAEADERAHLAKANLVLETTEAFAVQVENWNAQLTAQLDTVSQMLDAQRATEDDRTSEILGLIESRASKQRERLMNRTNFLHNWSSITINGTNSDLRLLKTARALESTAKGINMAAETIDKVANAAADGLPKSVGTSNDASAPARLAIRMKSIGLTKGMKIAAFALSKSGSRLALRAQTEKMLRDAEITKLQNEDSIDAAQVETALSIMQDEMVKQRTLTEAERRILNDTITQMQRGLELEIRYEKDLIELRDRRDEYLMRRIDAVGYSLRAGQAEVTLQQRVNDYLRTVQRAQLQAVRLADLQRQRANINGLLGSPATFFATAGRLNDAEATLDEARTALSNWLVALEYYAVRPFMDERFQLLLARNTGELRAIARNLREIQNSCGGSINGQVSELSVRDDLLGLGHRAVDAVTGLELNPEERFRAVLRRGAVPIDKRVRYSSSSSVGALLQSRDVWAVTFSLDLDKFANLDTSCNAKVASISAQLVGTDLGTAQPTVNVLYDGTSQLRSCQPDVEEIAELAGRDATAFSEVTTFRVPGRSVSLIGGIGEFRPEGTENKSLGGLPLASQYTVLIDREAGENANIDWNALEDIKLKISFDSQDLRVTRCR